MGIPSGLASFGRVLLVASLLAAFGLTERARAHGDIGAGGDFDWRDAVVYSIVIDRFVDGDPGNSPAPDSPSNLGADPAAQWLGGDLEGLLRTIEAGYFTELGVNTLWLTPPVSNQTGVGFGTGINLGRNSAAYHGFWPKDLDEIDHRLGDIGLLERVIGAAHGQGIRIILDYVMHHVSTESVLWQERRNEGWFWPLSGVPGAGRVKGLPPGSCVCHGDENEEGGALMPCGWDHEATNKRCWFAPNVATFDFTNADARAYSVGNAVSWVEQLGFDGYRLDAVKHIETRWLADLRDALNRAGHDDLYLVGEVWSDDRALLAETIRPGRLLDGQFDFALRSEVLKTLVVGEGSLTGLHKALGRTSEYGADAVMCTFLGSHDLPRIISLADRESRRLLGTEPESWRRQGSGDIAWAQRLWVPEDRSAFARVLLAYTVLMTNPGIPVIYYGDECGMPGAGDPDNRRMMECLGVLDGHRLWLRSGIRKLIHIRNRESALRSGKRIPIEIDEDFYAYRMTNGRGRDLFITLNRGVQARPVTTLPAGRYEDLLNDAVIESPFSVPGLSARILAAPGSEPNRPEAP